jgi:hypothetical protein
MVPRVGARRAGIPLRKGSQARARVQGAKWEAGGAGWLGMIGRGCGCGWGRHQHPHRALSSLHVRAGAYYSRSGSGEWGRPSLNPVVLFARPCEPVRRAGAAFAIDRRAGVPGCFDALRLAPRTAAAFAFPVPGLRHRSASLFVNEHWVQYISTANRIKLNAP